LYVGPSDGSAAFEKRGKWGVRCLRWSESGALYACGSEPSDPFSLGVSDDHGRSFRPLYKLADTCPAECAEESQFARTCQAAWTPLRPLIKATANMCSVPWAAQASDAGAPEPELDAAGADPSSFDAGLAANEPDTDAAVEESYPDDSEPTEVQQKGSDGCGCRLSSGYRPRGRASPIVAFAMGLLLWLSRRRYCRPLVKKSHSAG
jgi:hypothetical protein